MVKTVRAPYVGTTPGIPILLAFLVVGALTLELATSALSRVGLPVAPMTWAALIGLTFAPSWFSHGPLPLPNSIAPARAVPPIPKDPVDAAFAPWNGRADILDARAAYPEFLFAAHQARLGIFPSGTTFLAARFATPQAALIAAQGYREFFGMTDATGSAETGWTGARSQTRDVASVLCQGGMLLVWSARNQKRLALQASMPTTAWLP